MTVLALLVLGTGAGLGAVLVRHANAPRPLDARKLLADLAQSRAPVDEGPSGSRRSSPPVLRRAMLRAPIVESTCDPSDLLIVERTAEDQSVLKIGSGVAAFATCNILGIAASSLQVGPPIVFVAMASLPLSAGAFLLPDRLLHDEAERKRRTFRFALSSYLDLVNVLLAGGAGIESALQSAADAGDGWGYQLLRNELRRARLVSRSPWDTFADLAERIGVDELGELAANVSLAGSHGARIRSSLAAKADTLRGHQIADTESAAESATERMTIPVAVLLLGFLIFLAYPAVAAITTVTSR